MKNWGSYIVLFLILLPIALFAQTENWIYRYNGSGNSRDYANSIVYGPDGKIYAAGYSTGSSTSRDFFVISLTGAGDTNWTYRYNGPGGGLDIAYSIVYGDTGNIYAAGYSAGSGTSSDFTVISLTTTGDTNWTYRYDGPGSSADQANSIVYSDTGNIYAAGYSTGNGTANDFTVISLTTTGDTNWIYRYNGPGSDLDNDKARSIVYGNDGNIYAAGSSDEGSTSYDFFVVSLTSSGDTNWTYRYNGATGSNSFDDALSIVYGDDGNIYAAGNSKGSSTGYDFFVVSLTSSGDTNWTYRYDGPGSSTDGASSIVFGGDGNIYAAGHSAGDFTVISLTSMGDTNWTYRYDGPGNGGDVAYSIVYGDDGDIYAAGYSTGSGTDYDFFVISLTSAGDTNWTYRYDGPESDTDEAISIVYGDDGNIYAAGNSTGSGTDRDFTVISLNPIIGVEEEPSPLEAASCLYQNTPNPFYLTTKISFSIGRRAECTELKIFDLTGRLVKSFPLHTTYSLLPTVISWDGTNDLGEKVSPGVYFYKLKSGEYTSVRKMILVR